MKNQNLSSHLIKHRIKTMAAVIVFGVVGFNSINDEMRQGNGTTASTNQDNPIFQKMAKLKQEQELKEYLSTIEDIRNTATAMAFVNDDNSTSMLLSMRAEEERNDENVLKENAKRFMKKKKELVEYIKEEINNNIDKYGFKTIKGFNDELKEEIKTINFNIEPIEEVKKDFKDKIELYYKIEKTKQDINKRKVKSYDSFEMPNNLTIKVDKHNKPKPTRKLTY